MMGRTFDSAGDANAASSWFRDEAVVTREVAERLVPPGWTWATQTELFSPGPRLVLDGPRRARRR